MMMYFEFNEDGLKQNDLLWFVIFVTLEMCYDKFIKNIHKGGALWF